MRWWLSPIAAPATPVRVLLLVSSRFGNVSTRLILDDKTFEVWALYADFHDPSQPLPPHAVVFNAIGDADLCEAALERAAGRGGGDLGARHQCAARCCVLPVGSRMRGAWPRARA
jgi:hypothetical protein